MSKETEAELKQLTANLQQLQFAFTTFMSAGFFRRWKMRRAFKGAAKKYKKVARVEAMAKAQQSKDFADFVKSGKRPVGGEK